jgi:hypothetical protein
MVYGFDVAVSSGGVAGDAPPDERVRARNSEEIIRNSCWVGGGGIRLQSLKTPSYHTLDPKSEAFFSLLDAILCLMFLKPAM